MAEIQRRSPAREKERIIIRRRRAKLGECHRESKGYIEKKNWSCGGMSYQADLMKN
jgi:hypothetical protein